MDLGKVERHIRGWNLGHMALASELASWPWTPRVRLATGPPLWSPSTRTLGVDTSGIAPEPRKLPVPWLPNPHDTPFPYKEIGSPVKYSN